MTEITNDDRSSKRLAAFVTRVQRVYFFTDDALHDLTRGVLEDWTLDDLKSVGAELLETLTKLLKERGVYVGDHNVSIGSRSQSILDAIQSEEPLDWPQGTVERFACCTLMMTLNDDLLARIPLNNVHPDFQAIAYRRLGHTEPFQPALYTPVTVRTPACDNDVTAVMDAPLTADGGEREGNESGGEDSAESSLRLEGSAEAAGPGISIHELPRPAPPCSELPHIENPVTTTALNPSREANAEAIESGESIQAATPMKPQCSEPQHAESSHPGLSYTAKTAPTESTRSETHRHEPSPSVPSPGPATTLLTSTHPLSDQVTDTLQVHIGVTVLKPNEVTRALVSFVAYQRERPWKPDTFGFGRCHFDFIGQTSFTERPQPEPPPLPSKKK
ncbi:hypothetical protein SEPCBS57363_002328 [Sporothrix epigloea]|uniref:Uncharacterized protein n=1 Tax=Sporothrix epigloea TaxID=1892477 RepID=A0ABP0DFC2_9PEZI